MSELLQRLGVIVIEDAALFDGFPVLVWLMAAELKGFKLRREHAAWVLGAVRAAAACPHRDIRHAAQGFELSQVAKKLPLPPKAAGAGARGGGAGQEVGGGGAAEASAAPSTYCLARAVQVQSLVYSLILRRDYKCMGGDKLMFNACAADWLSRFATSSIRVGAGAGAGVGSGAGAASATTAKADVSTAAQTTAATAVDAMADVLKWEIALVDPIEGVTELSQSRWCLAGVDFHCTNIDELLSAQCKVGVGQLRSLIWYGWFGWFGWFARYLHAG